MTNQGLVSITFDDGRLSALTLGTQILEKYQLRGTFYIVTSWLGQDHEGKFANWSDVEKIAKAGHEIGNHSHTHDENLVNWPVDLIQNDIQEASRLFNLHNIKPTSFAYPYGYQSNALTKTISEMRFTSARTIESGINTPHINPLQLRSFMVEDKHGLLDIERELKKALNTNGWLILTFHHIDDKTFISTPPELFKKMIKVIVESNAKVVTVSEGLKISRAA